MDIVLLLILILPWKAFFLLLIVSGTVLAISAPSWFVAWIGLEINVLALLSVLLSYKAPRNSEASLKYFLVQALASAILITAALLNHYAHGLQFNASFLIALRLLVKIGSAPFHFWIPQVVEGIEWINCGLVLIWQKIAPFILLAAFSKISFLVLPLILSAFIGALNGLSQASTRKILAFSSINHISWLLFRIFNRLLLWRSYYLIYGSLIIITIFILYKRNLTSISQSSLTKDNFSFILLMMSLGGLPPFLGFAPKWIVISSMRVSYTLITLLLTLIGLLTLFFYIRLAALSYSLNKTLPFPLANKTLTSSVIYTNILGLLIITPLII